MPQRSTPQARILVVEDEFLIAMDLADTLTELGHVAVGPVGSVRKALAILDRETADAALLDENIGGELVTPVVERLTRDGIPFMILSGRVRSIADHPLLSTAKRLEKPVTQAHLAQAVSELLTQPG